jgi:hypothetical protein
MNGIKKETNQLFIKKNIFFSVMTIDMSNADPSPSLLDRSPDPTHVDDP